MSSMEKVRELAAEYRKDEWKKFASRYHFTLTKGLPPTAFDAGFSAGLEYLSTILTTLAMGFAPGSEPEDSVEDETGYFAKN